MIIDISKITLDNIADYNNHSIKSCIICNKEFKTASRTQVYCSDKCRQKYYRLKRKGVIK